jgi:hypothetical protein
MGVRQNHGIESKDQDDPRNESLPFVVLLLSEDLTEKKKAENQQEDVQELGKDVVVLCDQVQRTENQWIERGMIHMRRISRKMDIAIRTRLGDGLPEDEIGRVVSAGEQTQVERQKSRHENE